MAFFLNVLHELQEEIFPITLGMVNLKSGLDADYLEYDSFEENTKLIYTNYNPDLHSFIALFLYIEKR